MNAQVVEELSKSRIDYTAIYGHPESRRAISLVLAGDMQMSPNGYFVLPAKYETTGRKSMFVHVPLDECSVCPLVLLRKVRA